MKPDLKIKMGPLHTELEKLLKTISRKKAISAKHQREYPEMLQYENVLRDRINKVHKENRIKI